MNRTCTMLILILAAGLLLGGCQKQFTRQNYDTIYVGQPSAEVLRTLGKPENGTATSEWIYLNETPFYKANIVFKDGKVSGKSWSDSKNIGDHPEGDHPSSPPEK